MRFGVVENFSHDFVFLKFVHMVGFFLIGVKFGKNLRGWGD